jgi:hypothetical protein
MSRKNKTLLDERFLRKVLFCVSCQYRTGEEVWKRYTIDFRSDPLDFFLRKINFPATVGEVRVALEVLRRGGYVEKDLTRYLDEELPKDVFVYRLTDLGEASLVLRKKP